MAKPESASRARSEWLDALRELSLCCADDQASDTAERLLELNALLRLVPDATLLGGTRPLAAAHLQALLAADAPETAAMAMIGPGAGYLLSRSGNGESLATICLPGTHREDSGSGATPALALVGALALALSSAPLALNHPPRWTGLDVRPALH